MIKSDLYKKDKLLVNIEPSGNNKMTSRALYYQRKMYDLRFELEQPTISGETKESYKLDYKEKLIDTDRVTEEDLKKLYVFDFREKDSHYGRLNQNGEEILLIESNLKNVFQSPPEVKVINFVSDAFLALRYDLENRIKSIRFKKSNELYKSLKGVNGWKNVLTSHHNLMLSIYNRLYDFIKINHKDKKIQNFKDFLHLFLSYIDVLTPIGSITRSSYIRSNKVSPNMSGLVLEIEKKPLDSDGFKYNNYLSTYDYAIFRETAFKYGFSVDKHVPWRLVFDINSREAEKYISSYGLKPTEVFDKYYFKSRDNELDILKNYLVSFYNAFIQDNPNFIDNFFIYKNGDLHVQTVLQKRNIELVESINSQFDEFFWIKFYAFIKLRENNVDMNQDMYNSYIKSLYGIKKVYGDKAALDEIKKIKSNTDSAKKNRDYYFVF